MIPDNCEREAVNGTTTTTTKREKNKTAEEKQNECMLQANNNRFRNLSVKIESKS